MPGNNTANILSSIKDKSLPSFIEINQDDSINPMLLFMMRLFGSAFVLFGIMMAFSTMYTSMSDDDPDKPIINAYSAFAVLAVNLMLNIYAYYLTGGKGVQFIWNLPKKFRGLEADDVPLKLKEFLEQPAEDLQSGPSEQQLLVPSLSYSSRLKQVSMRVAEVIFHPLVGEVFLIGGGKFALASISAFTQIIVAADGLKGKDFGTGRVLTIYGVNFFSTLIMRMFALNALPGKLYNEVFGYLFKHMRDYKEMIYMMNVTKPHLLNDLQRVAEEMSVDVNFEPRSLFNDEKTLKGYLNDAMFAYKHNPTEKESNAELLHQAQQAYLARWSMVDEQGNFDSSKTFSNDGKICSKNFSKQNQQQLFEDTMMLTMLKAKSMGKWADGKWFVLRSFCELAMKLGYGAFTSYGGYVPYIDSAKSAFAWLGDGLIAKTVENLSALVSAAFYLLGALVAVTALFDLLPKVINQVNSWYHKDMTSQQRAKGTFIGALCVLMMVITTAIFYTSGAGIRAVDVDNGENAFDTFEGGIGAMTCNLVGLFGFLYMYLKHISNQIKTSESVHNTDSELYRQFTTDNSKGTDIARTVKGSLTFWSEGAVPNDLPSNDDIEQLLILQPGIQ